MTQGYITLALGASKYYEMAINLAVSVKVFDSRRPISLIHDGSVDVARLIPHFDQLILIEPLEGFVGCANKLRLFPYSPYVETMFIDSDCLLVKPDMDRHWLRFSEDDFSIAGLRRTSGIYGNYGIDIAEACSRLGIPFLATGNSGVMYFRRTERAKAVFDRATDYFLGDNALKVAHGTVSGQVADEPAFGAAMGAFGISPVDYTPEEGTVMTATWRARRTRANLDTGKILVEKPLGPFKLFGRFFPKEWITHSPTVLHFIGLKPTRLYDRLVNQMRARSAG